MLGIVLALVGLVVFLVSWFGLRMAWEWQELTVSFPESEWPIKDRLRPGDRIALSRRRPLRLGDPGLAWNGIRPDAHDEHEKGAGQ